MNTTKITALAGLIEQAQKITILTGAGISTESGIPDFRSTGGVWTKNASRESLMSTDYLNHKPKEFWPIYKEIFATKLLNQFQPNRGHQFLSDLEKQGKDIVILTQNVDNLHSDAGNSNVYEIHGSIKYAHCPKHTDHKYDLEYVNKQEIPRCNHIDGKGKECGFILHPNVVLFGGAIQHYNEALKEATKCDLFIVIGSSLQVGPINEIPVFAHYSNGVGKTAIINREATDLDEYFDIKIHGEIGEIVGQLNQLKNSLHQ